MVNDHFNQLLRIQCTLRNSEQATLVDVMKKQNGISQFNLNNINFGKIIDIRLRLAVQSQKVVYTLKCPSHQLPIEPSYISLFSYSSRQFYRGLVQAQGRQDNYSSRATSRSDGIFVAHRKRAKPAFQPCKGNIPTRKL
jgi:hypothetical protein